LAYSAGCKDKFTFLGVGFLFFVFAITSPYPANRFTFFNSMLGKGSIINCYLWSFWWN